MNGSQSGGGSEKALTAQACRGLFVYGTLRRGASKDLREFFENQPKFLGPASVAGRLYDIGEYPGLLEPGRIDDRVVGELFELVDAETSLARLDDYEHATSKHDRLYERRVEEVELDEGTRVRAWVYFYRGDVRGKRRILSGDYLRR